QESFVQKLNQSNSNEIEVAQKELKRRIDERETTYTHSIEEMELILYDAFTIFVEIFFLTLKEFLMAENYLFGKIIHSLNLYHIVFVFLAIGIGILFTR